MQAIIAGFNSMELSIQINLLLPNESIAQLRQNIPQLISFQQINWMELHELIKPIINVLY